MQALSSIDAAFLRMESERSPMHVGALMTFQLPPKAPADFLQRLLTRMREHPFMPEPFASRLSQRRFPRLRPSWEPAEVDMDYHLRHSALPYPGGERELGVLVARLHSHPLDLSRPLWEAHVIEGLENNRFAIYFKAHHCAIDGAGAMRMVQRWLSRDPSDTRAEGPWVLAQKPPEPRATAVEVPTLQKLSRPVKLAGEQIASLGDLAKGIARMTRGKDSPTRGSLSTPRSRFNLPVSAQRRLGTQLLDLPRLRRIAEHTDATVNDALLAVCGGAIRRYLTEINDLPEESLLGSVPMALPRPDGKPGTAAAGFVCPLGTHLGNPRERLGQINRVTRRAKAEMSQMSVTALNQLALLGISPLLLGQMVGVLPKLPPIFNFVVSNVVLSKEPLYLMGARLEAMYPVSFLFDGYALNITLVGYCDKVAVGFLGCRNAVPSLQRLAVYAGEELGELEHACGLTPPAPVPTPPTPGPAARKPAARKAPVAKAKPAENPAKTPPAKRPARRKPPREG